MNTKDIIFVNYKLMKEKRRSSIAWPAAACYVLGLVMKISNEILLKLHVNFVEQSTRIIMELKVNGTLRS